jgi:hypothetical protein
MRMLATPRIRERRKKMRELVRTSFPATSLAEEDQALQADKNDQ